MTVLLRVDADATIGLGHAMRCLALAEALAAAGHAVLVASVALPGAVAARFERIGATRCAIAAAPGSAADAAATVACARAAGASWIVVDSYAIGVAWQRAVRGAGHRLLVLDDEGSAAAWDADAILNQNLGAAEAPYRAAVPSAVPLVGPRYALLRREFVERDDAVRPVAPVARRLLVTLGGADPEDATTCVVRALAACDDVEVRVLVGAANPHRAGIASAIAAATSPTRTFTMLVQADDVPAQMAWADLAISAGGSTLWELARMRLPALLVVLADHQAALVEACVAAGSARPLGDVLATDAHLIAARIDALRHDHRTRAAMAAAAGALVDGRGAARVVAHLEACA